MQNIVNLKKPVGVTPLQLVTKFKKGKPEYREVKLGYAGRLDPMAEGVLLVLVGEENRKRKTYEKLQKKYTFDCLFGITTDTSDVLGLITNSYQVSKKDIDMHLLGVLEKIKKQTTQAYPPYSSRTVSGKPLYYYARRGLLDSITIPAHKITIQELNLEKITMLSADTLREYIFENIAKVEGNFRQKEILDKWEAYLTTANTSHIVATCSVTCSSGTYVRVICDEIGKKLQTGAIALRIKRTSVGDYRLKDSLSI